MDTQDERLAAELFKAALQLSPPERANFLERKCAGNQPLRATVEALLAEDRDASQFLEIPAIQLMANAAGSDTGMSQAPEAMGLAQDSFPGYTILNEIQRGGQGVVYQALQKSTRRKVAIKIMREGRFAREADRARFQREVLLLGQLKHPHIVTIHDSGVAAGCHFYVMDYIDGEPLDVHMRTSDRSIDHTLRLFAEICQAVHAAHLLGIIHRDLKPGNIRIDQEGQPHILDFGLAKTVSSDAEAAAMTLTGDFLGTRAWASPEQAALVPSEIDIRTDVYSLGMILYHMLTGKFPYDVTGNLRDVLDRIMVAEPVRPSTIRKQIDDDVETIVLKCLSKEPERRYQTAGELARDIHRYLAGEPIEAKRDSMVYVLRKQLRRYRLAIAVTAMITASVVAGVLFSTYFALRASARRLETERQTRQTERQTRLASAHRLAHEARYAAGEFPQRSLLLAVEAIETSHRAGEPHISEAEQVLRDTLTSVGGNPLGGLDGPVTALAICPDSRSVFIGTSKGAVGIWDVNFETGLNGPKLLPTAPGEISCLAVSPNGRWLVTASAAMTVQLWDLAADDVGSSPVLLTEKFGVAGSLVVSADSRWLIATGAHVTRTSRAQGSLGFGRQGVARLWDLSASDPAASAVDLSRDQRGVTMVAISPDSRWVATADDGNNVELWDLASNDFVASRIELGRHDQRLTALAISRDSRWLLSASGDGSVLVWDLQGPHSPPQDLSVGDAQVTRSAFGRNWLVIATAATGAIFWDVASGHPSRGASINPGQITHMAISPDGSLLATSGPDNSVQLWRPPTGACDAILSGHTDSITTLDFSADGRWLVSGSLDKTARLWDLSSHDTDATATILRGHEGSLESVNISPDGRYIVTRDDTGARLWYLNEYDHVASPRTLRPNNGTLNRVALSSDGRWLGTGGADGSVEIWDLMAANVTRSATSGIPSSVDFLAIGPSGRWVVARGDKESLHFWEFQAMESQAARLIHRAHVPSAGSVITSANHRWVVSGRPDQQFDLYDLAAADPLGSARVLGSATQTTPLGISADCRWLVVGTAARSDESPPPASDLMFGGAFADKSLFAPSTSPLALWKLMQSNVDSRVVLPERVALPAPEKVPLPVADMAISPDGRWLASVQVGAAHLWVLDAGAAQSKPVELRGHHGPVTCVAMSPDSRWLVTGSADNTSRLWKLSSLRPASSSIVLRGHGQAVKFLSISADSRWLATTDSEGTVRLWDLTLSDPSTGSVALRVRGARIWAAAIGGDHWVITASDVSVHLWHLSIEHLTKLARHVAGRELKAQERSQYLLDGAALPTNQQVSIPRRHLARGGP
jgi:WD40 repeat protein/tRNA A-37 threonylcarbamoyl transferase component Bud32